MNKTVPKIHPQELKDSVRKILPEASIDLQMISPKYGSYRLRIIAEKLKIEFIWGPVSGFGATDYSKENKEEKIDFEYSDESFDSLDEGLAYLSKFKDKYT